MPTLHYKKPPFFIAKVANPLLNLLVRMGRRPGGAATLMVPGRTTGKPRNTPVNPLEYEGATYLVAPRGHTHWARNLQAAGSGELRMGRKTRQFEASEVPAGERPPIIRAYLDRWGFTKSQFDLRGDETAEQLAAIAELHPVFRLSER
jgi:deazaflavin-dependent oxidoreductase (nitroreductase family)